MGVLAATDVLTLTVPAARYQTKWGRPWPETDLAVPRRDPAASLTSIPTSSKTVPVPRVVNVARTAIRDGWDGSLHATAGGRSTSSQVLSVVLRQDRTGTGRLPLASRASGQTCLCDNP